MRVSKIWKHFGWVTLELSAGNVARFLDLCVKKGFVLHDIKCICDEKCYVKMCIADFYQIKSLVRKTHTHVRICKKEGASILFWKYRKHLVFPFAILLMVIELIHYSNYIWRLEIDGNSSISEETLSHYLESNHWGIGTKKENLVLSEISLRLRQDYPEIIWTSAYTKGTCLVIHIQERLASEKTDQSFRFDEGYYDLITDRTAEIASIVTRSGIPQVKEGDLVEAGDVLVLSYQPIKDDAGEIKETFFQNADADIFGFTEYSYQDIIPRSQVINLVTARQKECAFLQIQDNKFVLPWEKDPFSKSYSTEEYRQVKLLKDLYLPIFYGQITYYEQTEASIQYQREEAEQIALEHFEKFIYQLEQNGVSIMDKNVMIMEEKDAYVISGSIKCCERLGIPSLSKEWETEKEGTIIDEYE